MNTLREALADYLSMRRALGFKLQQVDTGLLSFVSFIEMQGDAHITVRLALEWAQQPSCAQPAHWGKRLSWIRGFARYRSATDVKTEIPPVDLFPRAKRRARPYLYTDEEIRRLLQEAVSLERAGDIRRQTFYCLLGLLAVSGMRISEAINLKAEDVDLDAGVLTIKESKLGQWRFVPLHSSTQQVLSDYKLLRDKFLGRATEYFFISKLGTKLDGGTVRRAFYLISRKMGLRGSHSKNGPRIHDLRHRFAVQTLLRWYRDGEDVERRLPALSTYLGHASLKDTYWYLTACPELMGSAVKRMEKRWEVTES